MTNGDLHDKQTGQSFRLEVHPRWMQSKYRFDLALIVTVVDEPHGRIDRTHRADSSAVWPVLQYCEEEVASRDAKEVLTEQHSHPCYVPQEL
jgi:hypothetical protein